MLLLLCFINFSTSEMLTKRDVKELNNIFRNSTPKSEMLTKRDVKIIHLQHKQISYMVRC